MSLIDDPRTKDLAVYMGNHQAGMIILLIGLLIGLKISAGKPLHGLFAFAVLAYVVVAIVVAMTIFAHPTIIR